MSLIQGGSWGAGEQSQMCVSGCVAYNSNALEREKFAPQLGRVAEYYPECSFFAVFGDRSDVARRIARSCDVSEVPTFFLYKDGERQRRMTGGKLTSMDLIDAIEDLKYAE